MRKIITLILALAILANTAVFAFADNEDATTETEATQSTIPDTSDLLDYFGFETDETTMDEWSAIMYGEAVGPWNKLTFEVPTIVDQIGALNLQYAALQTDMVLSGYGQDFQLSIPEFDPGYSQSITEMFDQTFGDLSYKFNMKAELPSGWTMENIMSSAYRMRDAASSQFYNGDFYTLVSGRVSFGSVLDNLDVSAYTHSYAGDIYSNLDDMVASVLALEEKELPHKELYEPFLNSPWTTNSVSNKLIEEAFGGKENMPSNAWEASVFATKLAVEREGIDAMRNLTNYNANKENAQEFSDRAANYYKEVYEQKKLISDDSVLYNKPEDHAAVYRTGETDLSAALQKIYKSDEKANMVNAAQNFLNETGNSSYSGMSNWSDAYYWLGTHHGVDALIAAANDKTAAGHDDAVAMLDIMKYYGVDVITAGYNPESP